MRVLPSDTPTGVLLEFSLDSSKQNDCSYKVALKNLLVALYELVFA